MSREKERKKYVKQLESIEKNKQDYTKFFI